MRSKGRTIEMAGRGQGRNKNDDAQKISRFPSHSCRLVYNLHPLLPTQQEKAESDMTVMRQAMGEGERLRRWDRWTTAESNNGGHWAGENPYSIPRLPLLAEEAGEWCLTVDILNGTK